MLSCQHEAEQLGQLLALCLSYPAFKGSSKVRALAWQSFCRKAGCLGCSRAHLCKDDLCYAGLDE